MKNFNKFVEAVLLVAQPQSDSAGAIQSSECPCQSKDMFSQTTDDFMNTLAPAGEEDEIQPDDNVGETGEIQGDSEESSDVELECMGEQGLKVKYNGMEILLPKTVIDQIKDFAGTEEAEHEGETEKETEEHEVSETPEEETEETEQETTEEDSDEPITEKKKAPFWLKFKKGKSKGKKGKGKGKDKESDDKDESKEKKSKKGKGKWNFEKCVEESLKVNND